jgi:hypothetical protein
LREERHDTADADTVLAAAAARAASARVERLSIHQRGEASKSQDDWGKLNGPQGPQENDVQLPWPGGQRNDQLAAYTPRLLAPRTTRACLPAVVFINLRILPSTSKIPTRGTREQAAPTKPLLHQVAIDKVEIGAGGT